MRFLLKAFETLSRQVLVVLAYAAVIAGVAALYTVLADFFLPTAEPDEVLPPLILLEHVALDLLLAAVGAALYAVTYGHIGATIAGTIWRHGRPLVALKRFMPMWFILFLVQVSLLRIIDRLDRAGVEGMLPFLAWTFLLYSAVLVPIGAALMYRGAPGREEALDTFAPFGRHVGVSLPILLLGLFGQGLFMEMQPPIDASLLDRLQIVVPLQVLMALIDLVLFTWTFHLFRYDQATHAPDNDIEL